MSYAAIDRLQQVVRTTPHIEELSLSELGVTDLDPLLPYLCQLPNLRILKMANNGLTSLPDDLSGLRNLVYLDVSANPIGGLSNVVQGLLSLKGLKHLYIDFPFEMDEDEAIIALQSLESFNGTTLDAEDDFNPEPQDLTAAGPPPGPGEPMRRVVTETTHTVGSRKHHPASSSSSTPISAVPPHPHPHAPGGPGGGTDGFGPGFMVPSSVGATQWRSSDMEAVQKLYAAANAVAGRTTDVSEFEKYTSNVVSHLRGILADEEDTFVRQAEILKAKQLMYEFCFEEIARSAFSYDPNLSNVLDTLYRTYADLLESYKSLVKELMDDKDSKLSVMRADMQCAVQEIEQLMQQLGHPRDQNAAEWEAEKNGLVEEIGWLRTDNERLQNRLKQIELAKQKLQAQLKEKDRELEEANRQLATSGRQSHASHASTHSHHSQPPHSYTPQPSTTSSAHNLPPEPYTRPPSSATLPHAPFPDELSEASGEDSATPPPYPPHHHMPPPPGYPGGDMYEPQHYPSNGHSPHYGGRDSTGSNGMPPRRKNFNKDPGQNQRPAPGRDLSLRHLKELIEEIYSSKSKFDIKCTESALPRETLEQHLYTFLNQKYGLKSLILDWAQSIITAVRKYSNEDNDVAVFGKILRNELDDEFRFVQRQLKETVHDLLKTYMRGKYSTKTPDEINRIVKKRTQGYVHEAEWVDIIKYMYNSEDAAMIIFKMKEIIKEQQQLAENNPDSAARGRVQDPHKHNMIKYSDFSKVLLDFQLSGHDKFLAKFVKLFRQFDTDKNGIINEQEFRGLLKAIDPNKADDEINSLLDLIDPHNNQVITFSECVTFLSSELVSLVSERASLG
eukprot:TRINITY_DN57056_c0_g1_i1.p1 TRINITY_DN57056_c0_g1~~TRINITY_DN57056_c0_g1_i1.p1  ORF type:complete len:843 (-),score=72.21 TRINITY_DN57056_c0_g1_i1:130-2658(-)